MFDDDRLPSHGQRGRSWQTYEERFPRYANNAGLEVQHGMRSRDGWRRVGTFAAEAVKNALRNSDQRAADLYNEMSEAALDAAEALADYTKAAEAVSKYYSDRTEQEAAGEQESDASDYGR